MAEKTGNDWIVSVRNDSFGIPSAYVKSPEDREFSAGLTEDGKLLTGWEWEAVGVPQSVRTEALVKLRKARGL